MDANQNFLASAMDAADAWTEGFHEHTLAHEELAGFGIDTQASLPLVSAVIPCLNEEKTLGICIRKALEAGRRKSNRSRKVSFGSMHSKTHRLSFSRLRGERQMRIAGPFTEPCKQ